MPPTGAPSKDKTVVVQINNQEVTLPKERLTGLEIKEAAIAQGVAIELDFILVEEKGPGKTKVIGDNDTVSVNRNSVFTANDGDDDS